MTHITIIGLGPGDPGLITRAAWDLLERAESVYLRTAEHPAVAALPPGLSFHSFDHLYAAADRFEAVYDQIAERMVELARHSETGVLYAVPGDPALGEATTWLIRRRGAEAGMAVRVVSGVSFLEPACLALGLDPLEANGLQVLDAMVVAAGHAVPFDPTRPALLAQCYSQALASDVKLTLMHSLPPQHPVIVLRGVGAASHGGRGGVEGERVEVALFELDRLPLFDHQTTLYVPPVASFGSFGRLQETVAHLRAPDGCPWDREQTLQTLRPGLLEEAYEVLEALDADDDDKLREELGDLSLLVAMLAQIAAEEERFLWPEVMAQINAKLVRRHPHVFGDVDVSDSDEVVRNWDAIKRQERRGANGDREPSPLHGLPAALPALALAQKVQGRLARAGVEPAVEGMDGFGMRLWQLVAEARSAGVDAEAALRELCVRVARAAES